MSPAEKTLWILLPLQVAQVVCWMIVIWAGC